MQPETPEAALPLTAVQYIDEADRWARMQPPDPGTVATAQVYATLALATATIDALRAEAPRGAGLKYGTQANPLVNTMHTPPLDLDEIADGVRYADGNGTSDYWRGFNDGIDKLVAALASHSSATEEGTP